MNGADIEQISIGILVAVGILLWLIIRIGLADRRKHDAKRDDKEPPS